MVSLDYAVRQALGPHQAMTGRTLPLAADTLLYILGKGCIVVFLELFITKGDVYCDTVIVVVSVCLPLIFLMCPNRFSACGISYGSCVPAACKAKRCLPGIGTR